VKSTPDQLSDFKHSVFWQDICEELDIWLNEIRDQLENPDLDFSHRTLDQLGGSAKALRNVKNLPDVLIGLAEDDKTGRDKAINDLSP
jgi:hypothetical protein